MPPGWVRPPAPVPYWLVDGKYGVLNSAGLGLDRVWASAMTRDGLTPCKHKSDTMNQREGNGNKLLAAFQDNYSLLKRLIARYFSSPQDIDDLSQEAFLRAYQVAQNQEVIHHKSLLLKIARNTAISELRSRSRSPVDYVDSDDLPEMPCDGGSAEDSAIGQEVLGLYCQAITTLPPQCRKVYLMRKVYGMSHTEIAESLGISRKTVENHLTRGIQLCDSFLQGERDVRESDSPWGRESQAGGIS